MHASVCVGYYDANKELRVPFFYNIAKKKAHMGLMSRVTIRYLLILIIEIHKIATLIWIRGIILYEALSHLQVSLMFDGLPITINTDFNLRISPKRVTTILKKWIYLRITSKGYTPFRSRSRILTLLKKRHLENKF
uniref:Uncharacterized protein n=1 Tax=Glossina pallidipes TaxID=7398 RepID=A0A1B0A851_GLOPL